MMMMKQHMIYGLTALWALSLIFGACSSPAGGTEQTEKDSTYTENYIPPTSETPIKGEIYIAADESFQPIVESLVDTYQNLYQEAVINVMYLPGEEAIQAMVDNDSIRLVVSARDLSPEEKSSLKSQGTSAKPSSLATDAVALVINKTNRDSILTLDQVKGILTGEIKSWKEINPSSPLDDISVVFDHAGSSTYQYFRDSMLRGQSIQPAKVYAAGSNPAVVEYISDEKHRGAIGIIGLGWISDSDSQRAIGFRKNLIVCKLENPTAADICRNYGIYHQPYQGLIKLKCYPLTREVFVISRETRRGLLGGGLINFMIRPEKGQRIILKSGLVPAFGVPRIVQFPSK
jgi:phosphate transport system substrate-binding protein